MHVSGAHFNPAITVMVWLSGGMGFGVVICYVFSQSVGAIAGAALAKWVNFSIHFYPIIKKRNGINLRKNGNFSNLF